MTPTEILLTENEQNTVAQMSDTSINSYEIAEVLTAVACLTFFPIVYLIGNWFFH